MMWLTEADEPALRWMLAGPATTARELDQVAAIRSHLIRSDDPWLVAAPAPQDGIAAALLAESYRHHLRALDLTATVEYQAQRRHVTGPDDHPVVWSWVTGNPTDIPPSLLGVADIVDPTEPRLIRVPASLV